MNLPIEAKTRDGRKVIGLQYKQYNKSGKSVTFPIKGSIISKGKEPEYCIWKENGQCNVFGESEKDLIINN